MCRTDKPLQKDQAVLQQERVQGWESMPCGVHANPWRAAIVLKLNFDRLTACAYMDGRTLPAIQDVVAVGPMPPTPVTTYG